MADTRSLFPILEDTATEAGAAPAKVVAGDSPSAKNGLIGFSFRDSSGNLALPQLNPEGAMPVALDNGTIKTDESLAPVAGSATNVTVAEIALVDEKVYTCTSAIGSCARDALFEIVYIDDSAGTPAEVSLGRFLVGPGQFSFNWAHSKHQFDTVGGTGVQLLQLRAKNINALSDFHGSLTTNEVP